MGDKSIVCIDDEMPGLLTLAMICESHGYKVKDFLSPVQGLKYIQAHSEEIGLIFLDLMMAEMYGTEVLKALKNDPSTKHIPVIMNSCLTDPTEIRKTEKAGADDFISKPFSKAIISDTIEKYFTTNN